MSEFETITDTAVFNTGGREKTKPDQAYVDALKSTSKTVAKSVHIVGADDRAREDDAKTKMRKLRVAAASLGVGVQTRQLADRIVFRQAPKRKINRKPKSGEQTAPAAPADGSAPAAPADGQPVPVSADPDVPTAERAADPMPAPTTAPARRRK